MDVVRVHCGDAYVLVEPIVPEELEKLLTYWHRSLEFDPNSNYPRKVAVGRSRKLYTISSQLDASGRLVRVLITLPGFAGTIRNRLTGLGLSVELLDERTPRPKYDMAAAMQGLRPYQLQCAYDAIWSGGGIIACPTGFGKTHLISAIIKAHSHQELCARGTCLTVVITPGADLAKKNYRDLCEQLPGREVGLLGGGVQKVSDDVQVVTPESAANLDMGNAGLLFYDEVHTVSEARAETVMQATKALRYGLSATPFGRFDNSDKVIEGLFGPIVYQCTYAEAIAVGAVVPIKVCWLDCPEPEGWRHYNTHDANYRHGIWRNERMHALVGRLWAAIPAELQALAIVDKLEHMNGLVPALNGVTCVHAQNSAKHFEGNSLVGNLHPVKDRERDTIYEKLASGELKRVLSTGIYRQGVNFPQLAVLVNLAGMKSDIIAGQLPGRASRPSGGKEYGLIVDFWHRWDQWERRGRLTAGDLLRDDMNREKVYRQLGFEQSWLDLDNLVKEMH